MTRTRFQVATDSPIGLCTSMNWREKIVVRLDQLSISQAELARRVEVPPQRIHKWLKGEGTPTMYQGLSLARALELPYEYFADDSLDGIPPGLSEDDRSILRVVHDLELTRAEATKRLAREPLKLGPVTGGEIIEINPDGTPKAKPPSRRR